MDSKDTSGLNSPCTFISEIPTSQDDITPVPEVIHKLVSPSLKGKYELFQNQPKAFLPCPLPGVRYPHLCDRQVLQSDQSHLPAPLLPVLSHCIKLLANLETTDKRSHYLSVTYEMHTPSVHYTGKEKTQEHNGALLSKNVEVTTEKVLKSSVWG